MQQIKQEQRVFGLCDLMLVLSHKYDDCSLLAPNNVRPLAVGSPLCEMSTSSREKKPQDVVLEEKMRLVGLRVPARKCGLLMGKLRSEKFILHIKRIKPVVDAPSNSSEIAKDDNKEPSGSHIVAAAATRQNKSASEKIILLDSKITALDLNEMDSATRDFCLSNGAIPVFHTLLLDKEKHMSLAETLKRILPKGTPIITSFESVGHIVHLNLLDQQMPFKVQIGEAILKKLPNVKTVVVKTGKITDRFRVFPMEVIAGKKDLETEVKEHGCRFRLDYGKVYWNSRLQTEHARIVRMLHRDDIVCDMFCGIGPFAVPAGMKGVKVYANDLNPESFKWLKENVRLNKVSHRVECFNLDGREFVKDITKRIMATEQQLYNVDKSRLTV